MYFKYVFQHTNEKVINRYLLLPIILSKRDFQIIKWRQINRQIPILPIKNKITLNLLINILKDL